MSNRQRVSRSAVVADSKYPIGAGAYIDEKVTIGKDVKIGPHARILFGARIGNYSIIGSDVTVGPYTRVDSGALLTDGAVVCINDVYSGSSDARRLLAKVTVGPGVLLHDEVEIGSGAIIPTQQTIASIGNFGEKKRVVTIYGSQAGPKYSIGCQIGVPYETICDRVDTSHTTTDESAQTYRPYLGIFHEIGRTVQTAYDAQGALVQELMAMRTEYGIQ